MLKPKLLTTLRGYTFAQFKADCVAGLIVGIVALPLAIAFAIASGVSPERGLFTAIVAGFLISALGGSRVQIGGPTGAFVVIIYGIVQRFGLDGLQTATWLAGGLLIIMGVARFGSAVKFMPYPVIVGFTSGIAVIIFSGQIRDVLGLQMPAPPADFIGKWVAYSRSLQTANPQAIAIGAGSLALMLAWKRVSKRIPGPLVALIVGTIAMHALGWHVETIGSRFGQIPHMIPAPRVPHFNLALAPELIQPALTIALLAGIEALLSAVVSDGMIGGKHRSNMELVAQGVANIVSPLFGGIPATGAIARTATNVHNGGRTPVAGMVHALVLLLIMVCFGRWAGIIPLPCLAAILIVVAYNMSEWHSFLMVLNSPLSDVAVLLTTFFLTVFVDLTVGIEVGVGLAIALFMRRMALITNVEQITREFIDEEDREDPSAIGTRAVPDGVEVYEINGPFFFGAAYKFLEAMTQVGSRPPKVRVLRMRGVPAIDATGLRVLKEEIRQSKRHGIGFVIAGAQPQPLAAMEKSGLLEQIGRENVVETIDQALARAESLRRPAGS